MSLAAVAEPAVSGPELSVVVIVVDGLAAVRECLQSLTCQDGSPGLEILVPLDDTLTDLRVLEEEFPAVVFPHIGAVAAAYSLANAAGQHELIDMRRTRGLELALVALLEDRGVPRPDWARRMIEAHHDDWVGVGGGVENGVPLPLNEAVFLIDFAHFERSD